MARYYMQLRDGTDHLLDPDGIESADLDELKKKVLIAVRGLMSEDIKGGVVDLRFRIDAEDREGLIVYTLAFAEAVKIIPDDKYPGDTGTATPTRIYVKAGSLPAINWASATEGQSAPAQASRETSDSRHSERASDLDAPADASQTSLLGQARRYGPGRHPCAAPHDQES
jgi:hypothetical protein